MLFHYKSIFKTFVRSVTWTGSKSVEISNGNNKLLKIETGSLARFADGSATAKLGETVVLATVVSKDNKNASSFVPLTVDYRQRSTAAGLIPTTWSRRDAGVGDREILNARLIDRSIRPLFPSSFSNDTQVICTTHSIDTLNNPVVLAINAASAALSLSDIPWTGPVGAVQVGVKGVDEIIINPTSKQLQSSALNLLITVSHDGTIVMMDACGDQVDPKVLRKAIMKAVEEGRVVVEGIRKLQRDVGKRKKGMKEMENNGSYVNLDISDEKKNDDDGTNNNILERPAGNIEDESLDSMLLKMCSCDIRNVFSDYSHDKFSRDRAIKQTKEEAMITLKKLYLKTEEKSYKTLENSDIMTNTKFDANLVEQSFSKLAKKIFRELVLETGKRCDGRSVGDLRDISCFADYYPLLHGSALFQRGQTQVSCSTTFGSAQSVVRLDPVSALISGETRKDFFLHYEFPPYGTNEIGRTGFIGRRELGHGALAEKALKTVVPDDYPFTILLSAEVLESNGSSSMATVCAGSMALMDAGVPISEVVSGVAMGLVTRDASVSMETEKSKHADGPDYRILTDLMGIEDYMGDMDFKIASSRYGVTAFQMDTKLPGLPPHIIFESIDRAMDANRRIIEMMVAVVGEVRVGGKTGHPVVEDMRIGLGKRAKFLGVGGSNLKNILSQTGVQITAVDDDTYQVFAPNAESMKEATAMIDRIMTELPEPLLDFGAIYNVRVEELKETGAMVTLHASMSPIFIPNNQLDSRKVNHPSSLGLQEGHEIKVKYFGRDPVTGKVRLSRKVLQVLASDIKNHL